MMKYRHISNTISIVILILYGVSGKSVDTEKSVLVFGGNGQIGSEVVSHLITKGHHLVLVSRGTWEYDTETLIKPHVIHVSCDRYTSWKESSRNVLKRCPRLRGILYQMKYFDFVIDFSGEDPAAVVDAAEMLKNKVGLYIFISSQAVYRVCQQLQRGPIKEDDCNVPMAERVRMQLKDQEYYPFKKLESEEVLLNQRAKGGIPYMVLRLPDVIGPRDTTIRWWFIQAWIQFYHAIQVPIFIEKDLKDFRFCLVYTKDIATVIHSAMEAGDIVHDQMYNIGFDQSFTYKEIVDSIAKELKIEGIQMEEHTDKTFRQPYPNFGKGILDTSKIKRDLNFQPTSWNDALRLTVEWFRTAHVHFPIEMDNVKKLFEESILKDKGTDAFISAVESYGGNGSAEQLKVIVDLRQTIVKEL